MSFLASQDKLPLSTIRSAGKLSVSLFAYSPLKMFAMTIAQCLYVLTDENPSIIDEVRLNAEYTACLLGVVRSQNTTSKSNGKEKETSDSRASALRVLCCGVFLVPDVITLVILPEFAGILRNISPIPPPSIAATVDLDRDVVVPTLEPVLASVDLQEASQAAQRALDKQVSFELSPLSR